jgi:Calcium-activated chloride channel
MISILSVAVNCAIIFFTSNALDYIVDKTYSDLYKFMIIVMIEHIIIGFKLFISIVINDKPQWVTQQEHDLLEYEEEVRESIEAKKQEYLDNGGILLEQQMAEAKKRL